MASRLYSICDLSLSNHPKSIGLELFADLAGIKNPDILFNDPRHDVVVKNGNKYCNRTIMLL